MRAILYYGQVPDLSLWVYMLVASAAAFVGGMAIFRRLQRDLAVML